MNGLDLVLRSLARQATTACTGARQATTACTAPTLIDPSSACFRTAMSRGSLDVPMLQAPVLRPIEI